MAMGERVASNRERGTSHFQQHLLGIITGSNSTYKKGVSKLHPQKNQRKKRTNSNLCWGTQTPNNHLGMSKTLYILGSTTKPQLVSWSRISEGPPRFVGFQWTCLLTWGWPWRNCATFVERKWRFWHGPRRSWSCLEWRIWRPFFGGSYDSRSGRFWKGWLFTPFG